MPAIDAAGPAVVRLRIPVKLAARRLGLSAPYSLLPTPYFTYFFFGEAFFEAFNGSSVVAPANPRRSRGGALAFEIRT